MSPSLRVTLAWRLQALLVAAFVLPGANLLYHAADSVKNFAGMGLPGWFAYLIGGAQLLGGIGLLPRTVRLAALGLVVIMPGAVVLHATKTPGGLAKGVPALVLLALLLGVFWLRRGWPSPASRTIAGRAGCLPVRRAASFFLCPP